MTMTKTEAKRYVCKVAAESLASDLDSGAGWAQFTPDGDEFSEADSTRILVAANELLYELMRRGKKR